MTPLDDFLAMHKEANFGTLARYAWQGFKGGLKPVFEAGKAGPKAAGTLGRELLQKDLLDAARQGYGLGEKAQAPVGAALVGSALVGMGVAAQKIHEAVKKRSDFREMIALRPDLAERQKEQPQAFNAAYDSLRRLSPAFGSDPTVSGHLMAQMFNPDDHGPGRNDAGARLVSLVGASKTSPSTNLSFGASAGPVKFDTKF